MSTVEQHQLDIKSDDDEDRLASSIEDLLKTVEREPLQLNAVLQTSLALLGFRAHVDPRADEAPTWQAATTALRAGYAIFAAAAASDDVTVRVSAHELTLAARATKEIANADNWLRTCYLGMICRESSVLETLMNTRIKGNPEVDVMQSYLRRGRAASRDSEEPTLKALSWFLGGQPRLFAEALARALELHKQQWSASDNPTGGVALGPLAVACAASDYGFPVGVESGYLPKNIVERKWRNEVPVSPPASVKRTWRLVDRHEADADVADREGDLLTAQLNELIEQDPGQLHVIGPKALQETGYHLINDEQGSWIHTWDSITLAMQAYHGIFERAMTTRETSIRLRDDKVLLPPTGATQHTNADTWLKAMYLSMICRDRERINDLVRVPEELRRSSGAEHDEAVHEWISVLHGYWYGGYSMSKRSLEAVPQDDDLLYPTVELFYQISEDDQTGFTDSLARALERHRRYWTRTEERAKEPEGFLALAPLALAGRALESGWLSVTVRSPYLPLTLLNGGRVGEGAPR
ncbi:immunity 49 family protein [Allokutzneria albata]|uniref:Immunity protein 49 n=1 Tax=Allokutzneria albata TaxID=211114 RepID=A0A1G9V8Y5_ALLAB|nr:immunity 49 family protein [Allokutzneria albata]SDM68668.1 Immunity protein 49 [Allokutzneria albata]